MGTIKVIDIKEEGITVQNWLPIISETIY